MYILQHVKFRGLSSKQPQLGSGQNGNILDLGDIQNRVLKEKIINIAQKDKTIKIRYGDFEVDDIIKNASKMSVEFLRILGLMLCFGYGVSEDKEFGISILKLLVRLDHLDAKYDLYTVLYEDARYEKAAKLLCELYEKEHLPGMIRLGMHYYNGIGVLKNQQRALQIWSAASSLGSIVGAKALARANSKKGNLYFRIKFFLLLIWVKIFDLFIFYKNPNDDRLW